MARDLDETKQLVGQWFKGGTASRGDKIYEHKNQGRQTARGRERKKIKSKLIGRFKSPCRSTSWNGKMSTSKWNAYKEEQDSSNWRDAITSQAGKQAWRWRLKENGRGKEAKNIQTSKPPGSRSRILALLGQGRCVWPGLAHKSHITMGNMEGPCFVASPKQMQQQWQDVGAHTGTHAHPI
jgi:hypothetical protein